MSTDSRTCVVANETDNTVSVFLGLGDGTLLTPFALSTGNGPVALAQGDLYQRGTSRSGGGQPVFRQRFGDFKLVKRQRDAERAAYVLSRFGIRGYRTEGACHAAPAPEP